MKTQIIKTYLLNKTNTKMRYIIQRITFIFLLLTFYQNNVIEGQVRNNQRKQESKNYTYTSGTSPNIDIAYALKGVKDWGYETFIANGSRVNLGGRGTFPNAYVLRQIKEFMSYVCPNATISQRATQPLSSNLFISVSYSYNYRRTIDWSTIWDFYNFKISFSFGLASPFMYEYRIPNFSVYEGDYDDTSLWNRLRVRVRVSYPKSGLPLVLPKYQTSWNESHLKKVFERSPNYIEGIYEGIDDPKIRVAMKFMNDGEPLLIYLDGYNLPKDWKEGEVKAFLTPTATSNIYKAKWLKMGKIIEDYYVIFKDGGFTLRDSDGEESSYLKTYPTAAIERSNQPSSGTGFFISSNGYIATNYHVIKNAHNIKVSGVNENYKRTYSAKVIVTDKQNDLAILKVNDHKFRTISTPYSLKFSTASVGEDVFVLGYPLISTMGLDIKLTNGLISARTGYQGDVSSYQISAPVQPGNSGGPLFDKNGYVIGIVSAKHTGVENVGYAIKSSYLKNLIDLSPNKIYLSNRNLLQHKSLPQQVKLARKAICVIIVNGE